VVWLAPAEGSDALDAGEEAPPAGEGFPAQGDASPCQERIDRAGDLVFHVGETGICGMGHDEAAVQRLGNRDRLVQHSQEFVELADTCLGHVDGGGAQR
jgi:hypothetical protein